MWGIRVLAVMAMAWAQWLPWVGVRASGTVEDRATRDPTMERMSAEERQAASWSLEFVLVWEFGRDDAATAPGELGL